jgi:hypothetical protein
MPADMRPAPVLIRPGVLIGGGVIEARYVSAVFKMIVAHSRVICYEL